MNEVVRKRGRPPIDREPKHEDKPRVRMKEAPNWEHIDPTEVTTPDRLHIPRDIIPEGYDFLWATDTIYGQPQPQLMSTRVKTGWTPVHQEDFEGRFDGMFMMRGAEGHIKMDGAILMARPIELSNRAKRNDKRAAQEQVMVKEQALRGGDLPVSLDSTHPTAVGSNKINKSFERIAIPED